MPTTFATAIVEHALLVQSDRSEDAIPVDSPAWYAWLDRATAFAFRSSDGTFTAHKERRGPTQEYWKAYRQQAGRLHQAYLGKSDELTLDRLNAIAAQLAGDIFGAVAPDTAVARDLTQAVPSRTPDVLNGKFSLSNNRSVSGISAVTDDTQSLHLLTTKLALPPSRISLVPRPYLVSRFEIAIAQKQRLILVAAPAGCGKTTAVVEWLHSVGNRAVAWLALDDTDNQLNLFLAYLIAALETLHPRIGAEAWALLRGRAARPPTQTILTSLLNALAKSAGELILTLDDYHMITLPAIHEAIAFLLDHMPPHMHIIIATRADPPLPLARLRAGGQLAEVRAADLRFTREEAAYLFEQIHRIALSPSAVTTLESRTEGWATGLQLAALSLHKHDTTHIQAFLTEFSGSHTYVFDYLADEVFQTQPDHVRRFLLQTAILERLCGSLCVAVTGQDDAQAVLEQLDRANLFLMPLDASRGWYRYHPLFRDFLREHLERGVEAADRALLYRRASTWFEQQGLAGEAIEHAVSAQAWGDALRCFAPLMVDQQFYAYFLDWPRWLTALPDATLQADPDFCLRLARILILIGHIAAAERPLSLAESVWQVANNQRRLGELLGYRALGLALRHDFSRAMQLAQQALAKLPADAVEQRGVPSYVLGFSTLSLGQVGWAADWLSTVHLAIQGSSDTLLVLAVAAGMARACQLQGQLQRAARLYRSVIGRAGAATHQQQPVIYFFVGRLYYEWNDLPSAEHALQEGITVGQRTGRGRYWPSAYAALAWVRWARGDVTQTTVLMGQALASARLLDSPSSIAEAEVRQAGLWLAQGDLPAAVRWLATRALSPNDEITYDWTLSIR